MDPSHLQRLHSLLEATLSPDTAAIKAATTELNLSYYKNNQCIPALYQIGTTSDNQGVRQLSITELRKRILSRDGKLYNTLPPLHRQEIKSSLLSQLLIEPSTLIRHSLARTICAIADLELPIPTPNWPELLPFLIQTSQSNTKESRAIGIFTLFTLIDTVHDAYESQMGGSGLGGPFGELFGVFGRALGDGESEESRVEALRGLGKVSEYIEPDQKEFVKQFQSLIPSMLQTLQSTVLSGNVEGSKHGLDVFETLLLLDTPLISKHVSEYTDFCLSVAGNTEVDEELRCAALNSLSWTIQYKKGKVQSLGLAKVIVERLLPIGTESDPEDDDEDAPPRLAFRALDELAKALPPQQVFPVLSPQLQAYIASPDPRSRKAALMAFGVCIEGVSEYIRPHIDQLWPLIHAGMTDPEPMVRKAGCVAMACLCEWLQDECAERHAQIVPLLFNLISDEQTQKSATACLEAYLEILGDKIGSYLTLLMERLVTLLDHAPAAVQTTVVGAIGSAAFASKEGFKPYFNETAKRLVVFLNTTGDGDEANLRGVATDTLGTFAEVVGKDMFRPYFADLMKYTIAALSQDSSRARETSYMFFGTMAGVFEDEFTPYLPQVIPPLLASCMQSEANQFEEDEEGNATPDAVAQAQQAVNAFNATASSSKIAANGDDDDDEEDIDDLEAMFGGVNSEIAIEKEIAVEVVGQIFEAAKSNFLPWLDETVKILIEKLEHYYEGIRKSAISSLMTIMKTVYEMSEPEEWDGAATIPPLNQDVANIIEAIMPKIFEAWSNEDDKQVVIQLCASLSELINTVGPAFLPEARRHEILSLCKALLEQTHDCQQDLDLEEGENADQSEYDSVLISNAVDVISAIGTVMKASFAPEFQLFLPLITKYYDPKRSTTERSMTVGALGELIVGLQGGISQFTEHILMILAQALQDPEAEVRSNAAFASGAIIEWSEHDLTQQFVPLLGALQPYFAVNEASTKDQLNAKDNAAGAVARMIIKSSTSLPLPAVLPMFLGALPLKNDTIENRAVYEAIFLLFQNHSDVMMGHLDTLLPAFKYVLDPSRDDEILDSTKERLMQLVSALHQQVPDKVAAAGFA